MITCHRSSASDGIRQCHDGDGRAVCGLDIDMASQSNTGKSQASSVLGHGPPKPDLVALLANAARSNVMRKSPVAGDVSEQDGTALGTTRQQHGCLRSTREAP